MDNISISYFTSVKEIVNFCNMSADESFNKDELLELLINTYEFDYDFPKINIGSVDDLVFLSLLDMINHVKLKLFSVEHFIERCKMNLNYNHDLVNIATLSRDSVYNKINTERFYQTLRWGGNLDRVRDLDKQPSEWINYIEFHLNKAKEANYSLNKTETLNELRKVAALVVRSLEVNGCPDRKIFNV